MAMDEAQGQGEEEEEEKENSKKDEEPEEEESAFEEMYSRYKRANESFIALIEPPGSGMQVRAADLLYSLGFVRNLLALVEALTYVHEVAQSSPWLTEKLGELLQADFETRINHQVAFSTHPATMDRLLADIEIVDLGQFNPAWIQFLPKGLRNDTFAAAILASISVAQCYVDAQSDFVRGQQTIEMVKVYEQAARELDSEVLKVFALPNVPLSVKADTVEKLVELTNKLVQRDALPRSLDDPPHSHVRIHPGDDQTRRTIKAGNR